MTVAQKTLAGQKVVTYLKLVQESEGFWHAFLVFLGALFLLGSVPFYPTYLIPLFAALCGALAYKIPQAGVILGMLLAFPAVTYQSPTFALIFLLIFALVLFEVFENWEIIALLEILILAPFAFGEGMFGWLTILGMAFGAFHFGSKKSLLISIPAVFMVLLLSSVWFVDTGYFPVVLHIYEPGNPALLFEKRAVEISDIGQRLGVALSSLVAVENIGQVFPVTGQFFNNMFRLLISDSAAAQLIGWAIALFAMGYISGRTKGKYSQLLSSLTLLLVLPIYYGIGIVWGVGFRFELGAAVLGTVLLMAVLEQVGITISREVEIIKEEKMKAFSKFGLQDLGLAKGERGLQDVGGYEDVKRELYDAILIPLEKKELSYIYGIKPPSGVLLFGPPGTGKTMLMRALAAELKYGFYYVKSSELLSQWYGESLPYNEKLLIKDEDNNIKLREIGEIVEKKQKIKVLAFDSSGKIAFAEIKDWIKHRCTSPIYEVRTTTGRKIRVTGYHSLFIWDGDKIVSVATNKLIPKKSYIAVPRKIEFNGDNVSEQEFLANLKTNGSTENKSLLHATGDVYLDRVEEIKRVEDEEFVYDISVEPCQNFVAGVGGIFAHNSEKNVSEVFSIAREKAPSILFFDEIDSIGKKRTSYAVDDVGPRVLSVLLQEMDGLPKSKKPVLVMGATNVPNQLDPALLRPGRFDKIIYMPLPDREARAAIFKVHLRKVPIAEDVDFERLASKTERFSGADIKNVVDEAIKLAAKEASRKGKVVPISMMHFNAVLNAVKPSTSIAMLEDYEQFRMDFERRVGTKVVEKPKEEVVLWKDVAGLEDVKKTLLEAIEMPLMHEALMKEFKIKPSKGILLFGPPGTGKTLIAKAASNELKASFQTLSCAELMKQGYTQAVSVIKEVFNRARENAPAIIFVDEIETLAPARGIAASDIVGQFLTEMDGLKELKGVVVLAATNRPGILDAALLRPGRFDKIFYIPPPDEDGRAEIFRIHLGKFAEGVDLKALAKVTAGFSGADIAAVCQEAKMEAVRAKLQGKEARVNTGMLMEILKMRRPSLTPEMLEEYDEFLRKYGERR